MQVHVDRGGERFGPYNLEDVNAYLTNGTLLPTDQAWQDGMADWVPITQIPGVTMPGGAAAPPPPPAPAAGSACPQCQAPVEASQVICMGCGTQLQGAPIATKGGSKKALFISLGVAGVIGLAVGSYFLFFNKADGGEQAKGNAAGETNATAPKTLKCPYCKQIFPASNLPFHVRKCPKNSGDQTRPGGFGGGQRPGSQGGKPLPPGEEGGESDSGGFKPIHQAAEEGDLEAIKQHLRAGQNINLLMGEDGETPLHRAVTRGQFEAVKFLIGNGANFNIGRRKDGKTPLDIAVSKGEASIVSWLRSKGAAGGGRPSGGFAGGFPGGQGAGQTRPGGFGGQRPGGGGFSLMNLDKNRDGRVSKTEVPPQMGRMFDRFDSNKDGFIDQAEINALSQQGGGKSRPGGFGGGQRPGGGQGGQGGGKSRPGGFGGGQRPGGQGGIRPGGGQGGGKSRPGGSGGGQRPGGQGGIRPGGGIVPQPR